MIARSPTERIAVVGLGGIFPDAADPEQFWQNILAKKISIGRVSDESEEPRTFDVEAHYRPELHGSADKRDKTYTDLSALVRDFRFDSRKYRIPPPVAAHMDDNQKIALAAAEQALAGVSLERVPREKISVFVGNTMVGERHHEFQQRIDFQRFEHHISRHPDFQAIAPERREALLREVERKAVPHGRPITEDTAPGVLPNIIAARIASVFDFHGHAYVIDAACASGLAAIICGVQHLASRESDLVLCGAVDMLAGEIGRIYFSGIGALSPDGSFPFDERANGFVIGQGGGIVALKRLTDALRDGDAVHAVIAGYGQTSDGKGKAIAAPNSVWQAKTIERGLEMAGFHPDTVELLEAHGTATKVGDVSEIEALKTSFARLGATRRNHCAVGSVKSNIGHLKSAAGIAGAIKAIQALRHRILPPSANCHKVNPALGIEDSPFHVIVEPRPWEEKPHTRRAGVSAFGFGGANYHLVLEEYRPAVHAVPAPSHAHHAQAPAPSDRDGIDVSEILLLSGGSRAEVEARADAFLGRLAAAPARLRELALEESYRADAADAFRLALVADSMSSLAERIALWKDTDSAQALKLLRAKGIFQGQGAPRGLGETAFLLPGQGSQYPDMLLDLLGHFPGTHRVAAEIDAWWEKHAGSKVSDLISSRSRGAEETEKLLKNTRNTHPALLHGNLVAATLLQDMGVRPAWMVGHSAGEVVALAAAGKADVPTVLRIMEQRSRAFVEMDTADFGRMAAVRCDRKRLEDLVARSGIPVAIANINSPEQIIVSGPSQAVQDFGELLDREGIKRVELNVSHAFHSPVVAPAAARFGNAIEGIAFRPGHARVLANETCEEYPASDEAIRKLLESQVTGSVDFCGGIEELYRQGIRVFIEAGPGSVLGNLAQSILKDRDATVLSINHRNGDALESFQKALAALFAEGLPVRPIPPAGRPAASEPAAPPAPETQIPSTAPTSPAPRRIVYSGVSVGLPGSHRRSFRDDNFDELFEGRNFIERLTDAEKARLVDLRVSKVEKTERGPAFRVLDTLEDVVQLAGRLGRIDPIVDYSIDPKEVESATAAVLHGVAAGYEALRDARIPLVREYARTVSGGLLPDRWALPQDMQKRTGIIFAHGFPMVEAVAAEVSRHVAHRYGSRLRSEIVSFYLELVGRVRDPEAKALLTDWFTLHHRRLSEAPGSGEVFEFNHRFIQQISSLANNRLAAYIGALGPNFQINAACSSASTAITLAEEMIRSGRADRFLVIGSDDPTSEATLPYIGAGFLSTGAATCEADLHKAALPFDLRRNGMIMSSGSVGIVVEGADQAEARGIVPVCELLGSHVFNTAGHHARLDVPRYAEELVEFMERIETSHGIPRREIAPRLLYVSHETCTPARGGCSESEANALRQAFGEGFTQIEVTNTKGMTGHTMGASIEDALAARALQTGRTPPVVNHQVEDPALAGLKLSRGGSHACEYALRMAAGFGSQGNYILLRRCVGPADRIADPGKHSAWLRTISGQREPELEIHGRLLRVKDKVPGAVVARRPSAAPSAAPRSGSPSRASSAAPASSPAIQDAPGIATARASGDAARQVPGPSTPAAASSDEALRIISEITGYPPEMLEPDMELEADLGVDTVKQATILAALGERFGVAQADGFRISAYPTIGHLVELCCPAATDRSVSTGGSDRGNTPFGSDRRERPMPPPPASQVEPATPSAASSADAACSDLSRTVLEIVAEVTGYPPEMLEPDMELEADLGVDTVKQATILALLGERFGVAQADGFRISAYPTIGHLLGLCGSSAASTGVSDRAGGAPVTSPLPAGASNVAAAVTTPSATNAASGKAPAAGGDAGKRVLEVVSEITGYPPEMLERDMELEADLGVDTVKQATILAALGERFHVAQEDGFRISAYPTIGHLVDLCLQAGEASARAQTLAPDAPVPPPTVSQPAAPSASHTPAGGGRAVRRHVPRFEDEPLGPTLSDAGSLKILAVGDEAGLLAAFASGLSPHCAAIRTCLIPASGNPDEALAAFAGCTSFEPDVWVDLGAWSAPRDLESLGADDVERLVSRLADCRFALAKHVEDEGARKPGRILLAGPASGTAAGGLLRGFHLSLGKEWAATANIVELDPEAPVPESIERLRQEIAHAPGAGHVRWVSGRREAWRIAEDPAADSDTMLELGPEDTLLLTGGGNGIAAQVLRALAQRFSCRFVVVGRTSLEDTEELAGSAWDDAHLPARKEELRASLQASGRKVVPTAVDREFENLLKKRDTLRTLEAVRALGRDVRYVAADVCDFAALEAAVRGLEGGPVTAVIHAAGIDRSRPLARKALEEFSAVHRPKTLGAIHLARLCPPSSLKLFAAFTSISGVFGNAAQLDYAAGNGFLDGWLAQLQSRHPDLRARALAWSGWGDVGMAWRNDWVRTHAEESGLGLIAPEDGCAAALAEFDRVSAPSPTILHRGLGGMLDTRWTARASAGTPLIDRVEGPDRGGARAFRTFTVEGDEFLHQHRLDQVPLMPGVGFMEFMAEFHTLLEGAGPHHRFRELSFVDAFKLHRDRPREAVIHATRAGESGAWEMRIRSRFESRVGGKAEDREYSSARVSAGRFELPPSHAVWTPSASVVEVAYSRVLAHLDSIPRNVLFGPLFHESRNPARSGPDVVVRWDGTGLGAPSVLPTAQIDNPRYPLGRFVLNPCLLDSIHQAGVIHGILTTGAVHLPYGADEFVVCGKQDRPGIYDVQVALVDLRGDLRFYDIVLRDEAGNVAAWVRRSAYRRIQA